MIGAFVYIYCDSGTTQHVFLSTNAPTPCFGDIVRLICYYPVVMEMVNEDFKSYSTSANWLVNGELIFPDGEVFDLKLINQTTSELRMKIDPSNFTGDLVFITCWPPLTSGGRRVLWWTNKVAIHTHIMYVHALAIVK